MGFRVFALVTINDTDTETVVRNTSSDGTGTHGMFFRVNGAAIYSRGANMVPMVRRPSLATIWTCMMRSP